MTNPLITPYSITHYYHWSAELFFGFWRTYSSLDPTIPPSGETSLPAPRRMIFPHLDSNNWRDYAKMNQWVVRAAFPSLSMEFMNDWKERAALNRTIVPAIAASLCAAHPPATFHDEIDQLRIGQKFGHDSLQQVARGGGVAGLDRRANACQVAAQLGPWTEFLVRAQDAGMRGRRRIVADQQFLV